MGPMVAELEPGDGSALSAPALILSLMDSAPQARLSAAAMVAAGELLGIDSRAIRVAAARLVKKGVLGQRRRGVYQVGSRGDRLHRQVLAWHRVEEQVRAWDDRWVAVFTAHLSRTDKSALRGRERALRLKGFAGVTAGLAVRPANLTLTLTELRGELVELGLDPDAWVVGLDEDDPVHPLEPARLWDLAGLNERYRADLARLAASTGRVPALDVRAAARETLLVGRDVMHHILVDPLLPDGLVDVALRRRLIAAMAAYDRLGKSCWRNFYRSL